MQTFILISTGQNIANVLPVIERYASGDRVFWLESDQARRRNWSDGAIELLRKHDVPRPAIQRLSFEEHPDSLIQAIEPLLADISAPVQVGNGGTKPQSLALSTALERQGGYAYLYNLQYPAGYEYFPEGLTGPRHFCRYRKIRLDLEDLLRVSGHETVGGRPPQRLWPTTSPPSFLDEAAWYGLDEKQTLVDCVRQHRRARGRAILERPDRPLPYLRAPELGKRYPDLQDRWRDGLWGWAKQQAAAPSRPSAGSGRPRNSKKADTPPWPSEQDIDCLLRASWYFAQVVVPEAAKTVAPPAGPHPAQTMAPGLFARHPRRAGFGARIHVGRTLDAAVQLHHEDSRQRQGAYPSAHAGGRAKPPGGLFPLEGDRRPSFLGANAHRLQPR